LDEQDLLDMQITNQIHRDQLLNAIKNLPHCPVIASIDVSDWLAKICLSQYESFFFSMNCYEVSQVRQMKNDQLRQVSSDKLYKNSNIISLSLTLH